MEPMPSMLFWFTLEVPMADITTHTYLTGKIGLNLMIQRWQRYIEAKYENMDQMNRQQTERMPICSSIEILAPSNQ